METCKCHIEIARGKCKLNIVLQFETASPHLLGREEVYGLLETRVPLQFLSFRSRSLKEILKTENIVLYSGPSLIRIPF